MLGAPGCWFDARGAVPPHLLPPESPCECERGTSGASAPEDLSIRGRMSRLGGSCSYNHSNSADWWSFSPPAARHRTLHVPMLRILQTALGEGYDSHYSCSTDGGTEPQPVWAAPGHKGSEWSSPLCSTLATCDHKHTGSSVPGPA